MTNRSMRRIFIATLTVVIMLATPAHARYTISCSSNNYRYQYCGANTDGYARLLNQQSRAACVRGRTWGFDNGGVWVSNGCSAPFEVGGNSRSNDGNAGAAVAAGVGLAILGAIIANQDQDNDGGYVPPPQSYPQPYPPPYPYESAVPAWAIGSFTARMLPVGSRRFRSIPTAQSHCAIAAAASSAAITAAKWRIFQAALSASIPREAAFSSTACTSRDRETR